MAATAIQVRKIMKEYAKTGNIKISALRAGMTRKTARKYLRKGKMPNEVAAEHNWRTRKDPFVKIWPEAKAMLEDAPELEAKALFDWLCERHPENYQGRATADISAKGPGVACHGKARPRKYFFHRYIDRESGCRRISPI
jgi:hypothetical protein